MRMTAYGGVNIREGGGYWELSGPLPMNRNGVSCRACKKPIYKTNTVMVRDGRKLRFFYHATCFTGTADPRTQNGSSFNDTKTERYHRKTAPNVSGLEGKYASVDPDGREFGREVFKATPPTVVGTGKWSVNSRGFQPTASGDSVAPSRRRQQRRPVVAERKKGPPSSSSSAASPQKKKVPQPASKKK